jgi:histidine triad (HIT) family protein
MALTPEEADKIKEHLLKQLGNFPEDKREQIKEQVESMTASQVEDFVQQNSLTHLGSCIFCSIVEGKNPSFKIAEDEDNLAILEINPISKGNTLIVPKKHSNKISESSKEFTKKVVDRIKKKYDPKEIQVVEKSIMEHQLVEIIPIYGDETDRKPASAEKLKEIQEEILKPIEKKVEPKEDTIVEEVKKEEIVRLKPRIPN